MIHSSPKKLFDVGVNGKMCRLLKSWYEAGSNQVNLDGRLSDSYSTLSPGPFLLVMDPLLRNLQASHMGLSVNNFYAGGFLHADDTRTVETSEESSAVSSWVGKGVCWPEEPFEAQYQRMWDCGVIDTTLHLQSCMCVKSMNQWWPTGDVESCLGYRWKEISQPLNL